ncbi:FAD-dependent monooxygenase [Saccharothrix violaceirubra]|uniref:2-polyprenyl-6-methoxyphenol hydroxylase-like FAD-dependent oxidoreductase n=1 Tax=Saccharothrix violaceirubra TaxID=413306 RepID=A0A7W7T3J4_9PSEU|nr:FAD-dependent monooxygenase [Saccharothrix violaceirubra]MBB4965856.1 2-polyprenyl-6-methoxyphenol hydroxylase-like FAD-dependent oxidoreductase [Saccharothrix violaceirubra]
MNSTVLVVGAGIAGLTLAAALHRRGHTPVVVERAPGPRPGGQALDVRGPALDVLDRLGLLAGARAARTRMRGMSMHDAAGTELWRSTEMTYSAGMLDSADIEVPRDDLTTLLHDLVRDDVEIVFGDTPVAIAPDGEVTFAGGTRRTFDLVVGADGLRSAVRRLVFGADEEFVRHLGAQVAVFGADNFLELADWQTWTQDEAGTWCAYPVHGNARLRITVGVPTSADERREPDQWRAHLSERLAHLAGDTPRVLEAMRAAPDFYSAAMAQVVMDRWHDGRVVLLGDAAHCPSPLSGQGTSLALVGAHVLAEEFDRDPAHAPAAYEARMRPFVAVNQALATENPGQGASPESLERAKNAFSLTA